MNAAAQRLMQAWGARRPQVAVILGSGWGGVAEDLTEPIDVPYAELPGFPVMDVKGHGGRVRLGRVEGVGRQAHAEPPTPREVMVLMGRQHAYEHGQADAMAGAVRAVAEVGCPALVLTNAAGGIRPEYATGDLMLLTDHLNMVQRSPLVGLGGSGRFVDMSQAYDPALRAQALPAARRALADAGRREQVHEGVYAWMLGPQFETPAEIRMLRTLGADAVGMSTVPEAIMARYLGLRVLGLTLVTNAAAGLADEALSHEQTLAAAGDHEEGARCALRAVLAALVP